MSGSNQRIRTEQISWRVTRKNKRRLKLRAKKMGFETIQKYLDAVTGLSDWPEPEEK